MKNVISFDSARIAEGYKKRPFLHGQVIEQFTERIGQNRFHRGIDIGCGAGLSTKALRKICGHVTGMDSSGEMIQVAKEVLGEDPAVDFFVEKAENISRVSEQIDIVTAAGVVQWVDRDAFLKGLEPRMKEGGYLLVYDFGISDTMEENPSYTKWWKEWYLPHFPRPYRDEHQWNQEDVGKYHFRICFQDRITLKHIFSLDDFVEFMLMQSNVNARIEKAGLKPEEVREAFMHSLDRVFGKEKRVLIFQGYSWCFQKVTP